MKIASSGTQGSINNAMLNVDLSQVPAGSKANLKLTGQQSNLNNTDRYTSQTAGGQDARHENDSQLSKRSGGVDLDQMSISQPKNVMEVQKKLIQRGRSQTTNPIAAHNVFDTVGTNGIFQISPSVVKFAGFEANKTHTFKVRVINNSPAPQRLHILPPQTPYFRIRYQKKGMIPTGVSEDIYVQFTPTASSNSPADMIASYKYYYDTIRIHCEGDKILIPIHAFPVINAQYMDQMPKMVDMGSACSLLQTYQKSLLIESTTPVTFEYEITVTKPHPEIQIVSSLVGDILGNQTTQIEFAYQPQTYSTAEAEIQIRTTEFDSKPKSIRIVGSAAPFTGLPTDVTKSEDLLPKTLLTSSKQYNPQTRLQKLGKTESKEEPATNIITGTLATLKSTKMSADETDFTIEFRRLEGLEREKGIKFFQCVGDEPHTESFVEKILDGRKSLITDRQNSMRHKDQHRFATEVDQDKVVVDINASKDIQARPKWDAFENNHFAMRRRLVGIFLKAANLFISRLRAGKRLTKIKNWISANGIKTRDDMIAKVNEDYKRSVNMRVTDDINDENNIYCVKFKFQFNVDTIQQAMMKLPLQYEANMSSFLEKVEATPPTNFDDLVPFDSLEMLEFETEAYKEFPISAVSMFDPALRQQKNRPGCEYESILRMRCGEPDLEKIQLHAQEQADLLKQKKQNAISGANVNMPNGFLKQCDYSVDLLLRPDQHPTLRGYVGQSGVSSTETDPHFNLYPYSRSRVEQLDEIGLKKQSVVKEMKEKGLQPLVSKTYSLGMTKNISGSYLNSLDVPTGLLPGNFGCRVIDGMMPTDLSVVHKDRKSALINNFVCDTDRWSVPTLLKEPKQTDYLTDEESDDAAGFELRVPALKDLLTEFEIGDDVLNQNEMALKTYFVEIKGKGFKPELREDIILTKDNRKKLLNSNISLQKDQASAKLPGMLSEINSVIRATDNKLYLR